MHGHYDQPTRPVRPTLGQARTLALAALMALAVAALIFTACIVLLASPVHADQYCDHAGAFESALGGWECTGCDRDLTFLYEVAR